MMDVFVLFRGLISAFSSYMRWCYYCARLKHRDMTAKSAWAAPLWASAWLFISIFEMLKGVVNILLSEKL